LNTLFFLLICNPIEAQLFIVGGTLNPTVTYSNIQDTSLPFIVKGHSEFDIDIDFDNIHDIRFYREHSSSPTFISETFSVYSLSTIQFACDTSFNDVDTLVAGTILDENLNWNNHFDGAFFYYYFESNIPPPWGPPNSSHGICKKENLYVGFRKINQMDTLYGWFNLDLLRPYTIKSFAVNKRFDTGFPSSQLSFNVYPNPTKGKLVIENKNKFQNEFLITIINSQGQELISRKIRNSKHYNLDLSGYKDGLYFLLIESDNKIYSEKIIIN
jgi:hypothetical protein